MSERRPARGAVRSTLDQGGASRRDRSKEQTQHRPSSPVNDEDVFSGVFTDMDGFEGVETSFEGGGPTQEKKMDADFFNSFGDVFDEDDMKAGRPAA